MSEIDLAKLTQMHQDEVARQMSICNACRYCEGLCAVFPAMELRKSFNAGDVDFLSNLCHNCGACYYDCQYAPPHEFGVNVPKAMADLREDTYANYAWPAPAQRLFQKNGMWITVSLIVAVAVFIGGFVAFADPEALFASGLESGAFYRVMPHNTMVAIFGSAFLFAIVSIGISLRRFWHAAGAMPVTLASLWQAAKDAGQLRYLDGGGMGCMNESERPNDRRRLYHHLTMYGFLLCFASTSTGTLFHYVLDWQAPYPWWTPVKIFGVLGGIGIVVGPIGLLREKGRRDEAITTSNNGLGEAFLWSLILLGATGLLLTALRDTSAMGLLLAVHLGVVFAFFVTMPYGKFVHGLYRFAALMRHAHEQAVDHERERAAA
ncbi:tricarballylate utilization 4Fe-4S protein TcuB [Litoreibacter roseus]|uniref:Tricarballylate utilization protein B n=1 Tax=Litoreibacter roseus TaxID=2601869 RepID=A0A6N6JBJ8_9RHOB|nr:tricarballylate utilization 4Fe-4S protein TcuB [Litoreibacter roseus]GFE63230.1 tricarballylate utilization protein B [Litoreibacter roseus]